MSQEFGAFMSGVNLVVRPDSANGGTIIGDGMLSQVGVKTFPGWAGSGYFIDTKVIRTTDATVTAAISSRVCAAASAIIVNAYVVAKRDSGADVSAYTLTAAASRNGTGNITLIGSVVQGVIGETTGSTEATLAVNTTTQSFDLNVTGVAAQNYVWSVRIESQQILGTLTA